MFSNNGKKLPVVYTNRFLYLCRRVYIVVHENIRAAISIDIEEFLRE